VKEKKATALRPKKRRRSNRKKGKRQVSWLMDETFTRRPLGFTQKGGRTSKRKGKGENFKGGKKAKKGELVGLLTRTGRKLQRLPSPTGYPNRFKLGPLSE